MTLEVKFRTAALADLEEISSYISERNEEAAKRVVARIHHVIHRTIMRVPTCGRVNPETGAREFPVPGLPYLVIYLETDDMIDVIAIFHTSRDPAKKPGP